MKKLKGFDKSKLPQDYRHSIFCREYVRHGNGAKAAIAAGYSPDSGKVQASRLLTNANLSDIIHGLQQSRLARLDVETDRLAMELYAIALSRITDVGEIIDGEFRICDTTALTDTDIAAIASITQAVTERGDTKVTRTEVKMHDRLTAIKELARILGLGQDLNTLISGLRSYGLYVVQDTSGRYTLIDERVPAE